MSKKLLINLILQFCLWMCTFVLICYFHPTKETMSCNENMVCTIKHEFLYKFTFTNTFEINNSTQITKDIKIIPGGRSNAGSYRLYIIYDNIKPFICYNKYSKFDENELSIEFDREKNKFNSYIKSPKQEYTTTSAGSYNDLNIFMIFYFFLFFIWSYIVYIIIDEQNKNKENNM